MVRTSDILRKALENPHWMGICGQLRDAGVALGNLHPENRTELRRKRAQLVRRIDKSLGTHVFVTSWLRERGYRVSHTDTMKGRAQMLAYRTAWMRELLREYESMGD